MKKSTRLLVVLVALFIALSCTASWADVGNHNSYSSSSSSHSSSSNSGSDTLDGIVAIFQLLRFFIISPWYVKLLILGFIVYLFVSSSIKDKKIRKSLCSVDKSFLNTFNNTEEELKEIAKGKYLESKGPDAKVGYIELSGCTESEDQYRISYLLKDEKSSEYYIMVLLHPAVAERKLETESFSLVSLNKINKKTGQPDTTLPEKRDSNQ